MSEIAQIMIRLPKEKKQKLQKIAIKNNTNMNTILNNLIDDYLEKK